MAVLSPEGLNCRFNTPSCFWSIPFHRVLHSFCLSRPLFFFPQEEVIIYLICDCQDFARSGSMNQHDYLMGWWIKTHNYLFETFWNSSLMPHFCMTLTSCSSAPIFNGTSVFRKNSTIFLSFVPLSLFAYQITICIQEKWDCIVWISVA